MQRLHNKPASVQLCCALLCASCALTLMISAGAAARPDETDWRRVRLRLEWGGAVPQQWSGLVEISTGRFEQPTSLAVEADNPGSIWVDGGAIWLQRRSARIYDGFDVTVVAPPDAVLTVTLQSPSVGDAVRPPDKPQAGTKRWSSGLAFFSRSAKDSENDVGSRWEVQRPRPGYHNGVHRKVELQLVEIDSRSTVVSLGGNETRLAIRRTPGDALSINIARPHLIYTPSEPFVAAVTPNLLDVPNRATDAMLHWELTPARSSTVLQRGSQRIHTTAASLQRAGVPLEFDLPQKEGGYDIHVWLTGRGLSRIESTVQILVISEATGPHGDTNRSGTAATLVDEFAPADAGYFRRVDKPRGRQIMKSSMARLSSLLSQWQETEDTPASENKIEWNAYWLRVDNPERPHRLVVTLPPEPPHTLGISLLEPNAADQLMPLSLDTGVYSPFHGDNGQNVPHRGNGAADPIQHELIFWPRQRHPVLLLHDMGLGHGVNVDKVELFELNTLVTDENVGSPREPAQRRLVGPYMHKPYLPESFGAGEAYDEPTRRSIDDWQTFHTAALRLADYLKYAGYNSLLLTAFADGSTIYPSQLLQPTPRYDTGIFSSAGRDPVRKDVLELLYRIFDREQLVLVAEMQFSTPLPELEQLLSTSGSDAQGIELIGADGRSWREARGSVRGLAPYYNPLDPRVQRAILRAVEELVERYTHHDSFGGLAVELSSVGYLQLPGLHWGYDDATIERFERATGIDVPESNGRDRYRRRYEFLTSDVRRKWIRWRCEQLARFHQQLARVVTSTNPTARFFLAGNRILRGSNPDDDVAQALRTHGNLARLLAPKGLDFHLHAGAERFVLLKPSLWGVADDSQETILDRTVNVDPSLAAIFNGPATGSLFYHVPRECRLADFDEVSPWQPAYTWLAAQPSPAGVHNRERFARALASHDSLAVFDGGWSIPFGQEKHTRHIRDVIRSLPAVRFHPSDAQHQPAVVRVARHGGKTYLYVVNELAANISVSLVLSCASDTAIELFGDERPAVLQSYHENRSLAQIELEPFDVWACALDVENARVEHVEAHLSEDSLATLQAAVDSLENRLKAVKAPAEPSSPILANPGFEAEPTDTGRLPGWDLPLRNAAIWTLDHSNPRSGKSALLLAAGRQDVAALSSELPLFNTRMLMMTLWLRSDRDDTDVRLVFEATIDGQPHVQHASVGVDSRWRRYRFRVNEIPARQIENAAVRVEMRGPGKIWIDDVDIRMHQLTPDDLRQLTKVLSAITLAWDEQRYSDCQRLLGSYWGQFLEDEPARTVARSGEASTKSPDNAAASEQRTPPKQATGLRRFFFR